VGLHRKADGTAYGEPGRDRPPAVLSIHIATATPVAHVQLCGELAEDTIASFGRQLAALIRSGHRELYIDAAQLDRVSPVCAGVLNRAQDDLHNAAPDLGTIVVTGLNAESTAVLRAAGLHGSIRLGDEPNEPGQRTSSATG
jgi:anti-anti-sigma regulatory factor